MTRLCILLLIVSAAACGDDDARLLYLANEGVAVFSSDTTVLFDPLFNNDYGHYSLVASSTREAIFSASPPFQSIDAVFVSHHHGDHFDPEDMLRLLHQHSTTRLFAPRQAVDAMRAAANATNPELFERITAIDMSYEDAAVHFAVGDIEIDAFFVPHSGWPMRMTDIQNIAYRVRLAERVSIAHLGDADPNHRHFEKDRAHWSAHETHLALPPYWFFNSTYGNRALMQEVRPRQSIGIHVPKSFSDPAEIPEELRDYDLLITPGETRTIPID